MRILKLVAAALALVLSSPPALAQREVKDAPDPWVHAATGTPFPLKAGEFNRVRITEYSRDGRDAGASYRLERGAQSVTVTFYIYPVISSMTCIQTYDDAKSHIDKYPGARVTSETRTAAPSGRGISAAYHVRYSLPAGAMREDLPALGSELYLYCPPGNEWLVKYRATGTDGFDFREDVDTLMHSIRWPAKLGG